MLRVGNELRLGERRGLAIAAGASFDPLSLSPDLWFEADAITGKVDGDAIAQWDDLSGNARHATQATEARKPIYKTNIVNGKPVLRFAGGGVFQHLATAAFTHGSAWTVITVTKADADTDGKIAASASDVTVQFDEEVGTLYADAHTSGGFRREITTSGGFRLISAVRDETTLQVWVAGASATGSTVVSDVASASNPFFIGMHQVFALDLDGDIAALFFKGSALSTADRQALEAHWAGKYGL